MAQLHPFRGWRYGPAHQERLGQLISPPYDVISPDQRRQLAAADPHAFVKLILPEDGPQGDPYAHAAALLQAWQAAEVLREDPRPAFTIHRQTYLHPDGKQRVRSTVLGLLPLPAGDDTSILPHELTMDGPKDDRRQLMLATRAHLSPIFLLAEDADGGIAALLDGPGGQAHAFTTPDGIAHQVEVVDDADRCGHLEKAMSGTTLVIADGHHRFESACAARDEFARTLGAEHPVTRGAGAVLAQVASMASPGLAVLAFHRLVLGPAATPSADLRRRLAGRHRLRSSGASDVDGLMAALEQAPRGSVGLILAGDPDLAILEMVPPDGLDGPLERLEVTMLHRDVLGEVLAIDPSQVAAGRLDFCKEPGAAMESVRSGRAQAAFLLRPTPLSDLLQVTAGGLRMPQKSTNFYPKVPAGLLVHSFSS